MRKNFTRIATLGAVVAASGLATGTAFGLGAASHDSGLRIPSIDVPIRPADSGAGSVGRLNRALQNAGDGAKDLVGDTISGGPTTGHGPGPETYINAAIQFISKTGSDAALGLGGVVVGPIPSPTPGVEPDPEGRYTNQVNAAIQTVSQTGSDAALGLGGVVVGPIPGPTPGVKPPVGLP